MRMTRKYIEQRINEIIELYKTHNNLDVKVLKSLVKYPNQFRYQLVKVIDSETGGIEPLTDYFDTVNDLYTFSLYMTTKKFETSKLMNL